MKKKNKPFIFLLGSLRLTFRFRFDFPSFGAERVTEPEPLVNIKSPQWGFI